MREIQQRQLEALRRVQGFVSTHAGVLGPIAELEGRKDVEAAVSAVDELVNGQGAANRFIAGEMGREAALTRQLVKEHLIPVARFARARLADVPEYKALTPAVQSRGGKMVGSARVMATAVAKHRDTFVAGGFAADESEQINRLVDDIMGIRAERAKLRGGRVNATKTIRGTIAKGLAGARHLDALIIKQFASNPGLLAEWSSVSRVWDRAGATRKPVVKGAEGAVV
jgi:hypothetical protein